MDYPAWQRASLPDKDEHLMIVAVVPLPFRSDVPGESPLVSETLLDPCDTIWFSPFVSPRGQGCRRERSGALASPAKSTRSLDTRNQ